MEEVGTHMATLERGGDREKKESASERRKCRYAVANRKRESIQQQCCTVVQQWSLPSFFSRAVVHFPVICLIVACSEISIYVIK
jgi:hypothetical protein